MIEQTLYGALATGAFAIFANLSWPMVPLATLGAGISWLAYLALNAAWGASTMSLFFAAAIAGIYSEIVARVAHKPATSFVLPSIVCLVPGTKIYFTMSAAVTGSIEKATTLGVETLSNAGAIASGVAFITSLVLITRHVARVVVQTGDTQDNK
jgi:uncharacterized membrane protein YjjB (DUF3815 family)